MPTFLERPSYPDQRENIASRAENNQHYSHVPRLSSHGFLLRADLFSGQREYSWATGSVRDGGPEEWFIIVAKVMNLGRSRFAAPSTIASFRSALVSSAF